MAEEDSGGWADAKSRIAGLITAVLVTPVYFAFAHFGRSQKGFLVACVMGVFAAVIYVRKRALLNPYSISSISILFVVQMLCVLLVDIPVPQGFSIAVLPFAIADAALLFAILSLVEQTFSLSEKHPHAKP